MDDAKTSEIRCRMDEVRSGLGDDLEEIVEAARTLTDWRHYVKRFPWACLASAVALGYIVVPRRVEITSPDADALEELAKRNKLVIRSDPQPQAKSGLIDKLVSKFAGAVVRETMKYVGNNVAKVIASRDNNKGERDGKPNR